MLIIIVGNLAGDTQQVVLHEDDTDVIGHSGTKAAGVAVGNIVHLRNDLLHQNPGLLFHQRALIQNEGYRAAGNTGTLCHIINGCHRYPSPRFGTFQNRNKQKRERQKEYTSCFPTSFFKYKSAPGYLSTCFR